jgi:hypothetical protein
MKYFLLFLFLMGLCSQVSAQKDNPVEYMKFFTDREFELSKKYLSYMSEVAHGHRARKLEKRRQDLLTSIKQSIGEASKMRPYNGDASLRDVYKKYWDVLLKVFNEDYDKIVNMEEIAEQSYDNMEAYLLAQERAETYLDNEAKKISPIYQAFAEKNNIRLVDNGDTNMEKKMRKVSRVSDYHNKMFLIFFKTFKQEVYVWDAVNRRDLNALEQNNNTLINYVNEGLAKLDTIKGFDGDGSFMNACRKVLEYYGTEAKQKVPGLSDYVIKTDDFEKTKKAYDAKSPAKRTQADIDGYNKAVNDVNASIVNYNAIVNQVNESRAKTLENWENASKRFMDTYMPKAK